MNSKKGKEMENYRSVNDFVLRNQLKDCVDPKAVLNENSIDKYVCYTFCPTLYGYILPLKFLYKTGTEKEYIFVVYNKNRSGCYMYVSEEIYCDLQTCQKVLSRYMSFFPLYGLSKFNKFKYKGIFSF